MAPKAAKKTTKKATTTKKVVKKAAKKVVKKAVKATKKATKKTTTAKKVVKKAAKKVVKKAAKKVVKKAAKASPKKKVAKASSPKKKKAAAVEEVKAAAVEEVKAAEEAAPEKKDDFYTAKNDGAVDIGDSYLGTGSGENTTLTADLFHQHGDIQVMQSWETPFMHALADALVAHLNANKAALMAHGKISVLEIGFGLGLSATKLQEGMQDLVAEYGNQLIEHHIVELNDAVYANLEKFAADEAAKGRAKVVPHKGNWKDVVQDLIGKELYSGLLYDPFPTCKEEQHYHQLMFVSDQHAGPLLHKGGALVYCNLTSLGVLCADRAGDWSKVWNETQKPYLLGQSFDILRTEYKCTGFTDDSVSYSLFKITDDMKVKRKEQKCNYYGGDDHNFALVPVCVKQ